EVGVLAWSHQSTWVLDLQPVPSDDVIDEGLAKLRPEGGTDLLHSLDRAAEALRDSKASLKHIILFTDGFTSTNNFDVVADQASSLADEGITVSVLATGETFGEATT